MKDEWRPTKGGLSGVYSDDAEGEERKEALKNKLLIGWYAPSAPPQ